MTAPTGAHLPRGAESSATRRRAPVAIVGGGLAGITAANYLRRQGVDVVVFEAGRELAGLAASFHDTDGFVQDFGAHFVTNRLAAAVGLGHQCRTVRRYGETVLLGRRRYTYPFGLMREPRFAWAAVVSRTRRRNATPAASAADWFRAEYGSALAEEVALPLIEAWSGAPASELAASVGDKIPTSMVHTVLRKIAGRLTHRAVAIGYSNEVPESAHVWHVYPEGGVSTIVRHLAAPVADAIRLESPVEAIHTDGGRVVGVSVRGTLHEASAVVSTAPVHVLAKLVQGTDRLRPLARFRYRAMTFVNMKFDARGILPDVVVWTPEHTVPFFRLTETPLSMPWLAPAGKTLITADIGCVVGDDVWRADDASLGDLCVARIREMFGTTAPYLGCRVLRTPIAYPVFRLEYESERVSLKRSTGVVGLYSIGRNGEFSHMLMEDVYWRTLAVMRHLVADAGGNATHA